MYEMLSGRLPFPEGSLQQTLRRHQCDHARPLNTLVADLPRALVDVVHDMLAHQPPHRPSAASIVRRLVNLEIASLGRRRSA